MQELVLTVSRSILIRQDISGGFSSFFISHATKSVRNGFAIYGLSDAVSLQKRV